MSAMIALQMTHNYVFRHIQTIVLPQTNDHPAIL